ncbi:MAG: flagellar assembly protein FliW [Acidobacteria bacterium]|nr:flagellar assembly protein FliW [Acidobacteriota bacterium]
MAELEREGSMLTANAPIHIERMALKFHHDLPGFRGARNFMIEPLGEPNAEVFASLRCSDTVYVQENVPIDNLVLLVMSPGAFWSDYEVRVEDPVVAELELTEANDAALLVIVHPKEPLTQSTVNLYSPIVYNRRTGAADQIVPATTEQEVGWSIRAPFPSE